MSTVMNQIDFIASFAALLGIAGEIAFRELSLEMLYRRFDIGRTAAAEIGTEVVRLGLSGRSIDYRRLRDQRPRLTEAITGAGPSSGSSSAPGRIPGLEERGPLRPLPPGPRFLD